MLAFAFVGIPNIAEILFQSYIILVIDDIISI